MLAFRDPRIQIEIQRKIAAISTKEGRVVAERIVREMCSMGTSSTLEALVAPKNYIRPVVSTKEFLDDPYFLGDMENLRPRLRSDLIALFDEGQYVEAVVDGAIGWGKSVFVSISFAYMIYRLSCLTNPQAYFGILPGSTIYFVNQSMNQKLAKKVIFGELRARLDVIPYFLEEFPYDKDLRSELVFPKRIVALPVASEDTSAIGLNVFGGVLDEVNFMPVVSGSKRSRTVNEAYDTPARLYNTISRRLRSRFLGKGGLTAGKIMIVGSSQYPDDFTERKKGIVTLSALISIW